ncbi:LysR family transcriptional regulator [Streptomyces scabiei]|uniref:LysR substrate-binding domain-containing protein n=1 Tax=Streptomyces scabiei TaxID=1930 RepID=UPI0029B737A4|nr:LysR family transcriptional regulator [Streptomyces scabiei]MDX3522710.1 LysR family transcriptional regulator [Streptomyces scabiei]
MDVRQLEYVVTLADTLHFGRAAERMHIAQSAFSTQIARLERQIGAVLFDRAANRVSLTPAGEAFLPRAQAILADIAEASSEARIRHTAGSNHLTIGLFCDSAGELTPLIVEAFRRTMPHVQLSFTELSMINQVDALVNGDVDVAFVRSPLAHISLDFHGLFAEPRFVGVGIHHELTQRAEIHLADLADQAFAVAAPEAPAKWRAYWSCDDFRGEPGRVAAFVTNVPESLNAIAYAGAVDTFPGSATRFLRFPGIVYKPLTDGTYSAVTLATRKSDHRSQVTAFRSVATHLAGMSLSVVPDAVPFDEDAHLAPVVAP